MHIVAALRLHHCWNVYCSAHGFVHAEPDVETTRNAARIEAHGILAAPQTRAVAQKD